MKESKKIIIGTSTIIGVGLIGAAFIFGKYVGWNEVGRALVDAFENDGPDMLFEDKRTHLIYNMSAYCIGD